MTGNEKDPAKTEDTAEDEFAERLKTFLGTIRYCKDCQMFHEKHDWPHETEEAFIERTGADEC